MKLLKWIFKAAAWTLFFAVAIILILANIRPSGVKANSNYQSETVNNAGNDAALAEIRKEPKVKEAIITSVNVLYVSVIDDGTKRDGYAAYLCEILREHHAKANRVKVVRLNSTNDPHKDNAYGVLLGESWCK
jgi:hypothetical protein